MLPDCLTADTAVALDQYLVTRWQVTPGCRELQAEPEQPIALPDLLDRLTHTSGLLCQWLAPTDALQHEQTFAFTREGDLFCLDAGDSGWRIQQLGGPAHSENLAADPDWRRIQRQFALVTPWLVCTPEMHQDGADEPPVRDEQPPDTLWKEFRRHGALIRSILGVSLMIAFLGVITPLGFQTFADKILPYQAQGSLLVLAAFLLMGAMATSLLQCYRDYQEHVLSARYASGLGRAVFERLLHMGIPYFDQRTVGDLTKLVEQVDESTQFLTRQLLGSVVSLLSLLVIVPLLFVYSPGLTGIVLAISAAMTLTVAGSLLPLRARVMHAYQLDARFQSVTIELLKGMRTIKSLTNEPYFLGRTQSAMSQSLHGQFQVDRLNTVISAVVSFQSQLITLAVIFFGAQAVFSQTMTIGQLIAFNMLANNVVQPLVSLVMTGQGWANFRLAQRKLAELAPVPVQPRASPEASIQLPGDIVLSDVVFGYETGTPVLNGFNLRVRAGETLGIVGASGSGKSTLTNLLMGFYRPWSGDIHIGTQDVGKLPASVLRTRIAAVPQHSFLFNTSVARNVRLGRLDAPTPALEEALKEARCGDFVAGLTEGVDTCLSENGDNLSGGQRQRLAIARALLRDSDILVFDEATSALDARTEQAVKQTIMRACEGRTAIVIAHRLSTLSECDRIALMSDGKVIAVDSHEQLLATEPAYAELVNAAHALAPEASA